MGQYYVIVNLDKGEFIKPHDFGDGAKLMEFGLSGMGVMAGLAVLLASGNGRGGGDLRTDAGVVGRWAGDRIVIAGDYDDEGLYGIKGRLYTVAHDDYANMGARVMEALLDDSYVREEWSRDNGRSDLMTAAIDARKRPAETEPRR